MTSNIVWSWRDALFGVALSVIGALVIISGDISSGMALLIGSLPPVALGLQPKRRDRIKLAVIGTLLGISYIFGSILAQWAIVAVIAMFILSFGAVKLAPKSPIGIFAMGVGLPFIGLGLSSIGLENSLSLGLLIITGSILAMFWSMLFKEFSASDRQAPISVPADQVRSYGILLGLAAAVATAIGFAKGVAHIGWITASTLFVMRPNWGELRMRSAGRAISVAIGALAAAFTLSLDLSAVAIALLAVVVLSSASAIHSSRWYIIPAFTTYFILWTIVYAEGSADAAQATVTERVSDTVIGVVVALIFGAVIPKILSWRHRHRDPTAL